MSSDFTIKRTAALAVAGMLAALAPACRDATQIVLNVHTNMPCSGDAPWQGVAVYVGKPGQDVENAAPTLVTDSCDEHGSVGSLVIVPSGGKDAELALRVVAGVERNPEQCAENGYQGCIVARRSLRFTPHDSLDLEVELAQDCVSVACDAEHTCQSGRCIDSEIATPLSNPEPVTGPSVRCGDDGVRCSTQGDVCCLTVHAEAEPPTATGECRPAELCDQPSIVLHCDDDSDCAYLYPQGAERGGPPFCALSYQGQRDAPTRIAGSACGFASPSWLDDHFGLGMCQDGKPCVDGRFQCGLGNNSQVLPNYLWCLVQVELPLL